MSRLQGGLQNQLGHQSVQRGGGHERSHQSPEPRPLEGRFAAPPWLTVAELGVEMQQKRGEELPRRRRKGKEPENSEPRCPPGGWVPGPAFLCSPLNYPQSLGLSFLFRKLDLIPVGNLVRIKARRHGECLGRSGEHVRRTPNLGLLTEYNETEFLLKTLGLRIHGHSS